MLRSLCVFAAISAFGQGGTGLAATQTVVQKGKQFSLTEIKVKVGDTIVFKNEDDTAHNVFSTTAGSAFNLKVQKPGAENSQEFKAPGEVEVRCAIHPKMLLKVKVE